MDSKVSIIVPIYKVPENMLKKCIESCINQTLKEIEIILIDDESPDNCGKICDEYAKKDSRIKVIHQKNKGLSGARNSGVRNANGKWITFLDGDDWIECELCECLYKNAEEQNVDIVFSCMLKDYGKKIYKYKYTKFLDKNLYIDEECKYLQKEVLDFNSNISTSVAKIIRRNMLIEKGIWFNEELKQGAEGIEFNLRLFGKVNRVFFIEKYFYHYTYNSNSISASFNEENYIYVLKCFEKIKDYITTLNCKDDFLQLFYTRMLYVIVTATISGYFNPSNKDCFKLKKEKYNKYLQEPLVVETLKKSNKKNIDILRRITLILIKLRCFRIINLLAFIRKKNKN